MGREEQEKARGEVLGRDAVQCVGLGRIPRSRAAMSASKGFYRTVCRYLPTLMEMYKLDELTTIRTLQHNIKQKFYENKTIKDPNNQRHGPQRGRGAQAAAPHAQAEAPRDHKVRRDARPLRHQGTPKRIPGAVLRLKLRWQMGYRGPAGGAYA